MDRLKKVLVGVDFSPCSAAALQQAVRIGQWNRAEVTALHVVPMPVYAVPDASPVIDLPPIEMLIDDAKEQWANWAPAREAGAAIKFACVVGVARADIPDYVRKEAADLLVLGANGDFKSSVRLGSTAAACVQHAPARVLVVREKHAASFQSVVACIDFSETSRTALEQAIRVAAQDGAVLHVLHVYEDPWKAPLFRAGKPDVDQRRATYHQAIEKHLRSFCGSFSHEVAALKALFHVQQARRPGEGILDFIQHHSCDLAVLGTRAKWNLRDFVWGSTAERVVREARCAILTVKLSNNG